jgi:DNA-binding MarR family transcriptional regulator
MGKQTARRTGASPSEGALEFMRVLWALDHALRSRSKRMRSHLGVTGPQRLVIRLVGRTPGIAAGELAETLHVHPSTLTGVLERLVRRRLLLRKSDAKDGRRSVFYLSERGRTLDKIRSGTVEAGVLRALSSLDARSVAAAREVLETVVNEIERD